MPYRYKVVELRERLIGGKMSGDKLEKILNTHAQEGWQLRAITAADVKGRVGPATSRACCSPSSGRSAEPAHGTSSGTTPPGNAATAVVGRVGSR
jgi:hypothetical protein